MHGSGRNESAKVLTGQVWTIGITLMFPCDAGRPDLDPPQSEARPDEGAVRLRGGFGTPRSPIHTGFVEVLHNSEWGAICAGLSDRGVLMADVVCRQLGFPHGTAVDPTTNPQSMDQSDPTFRSGIDVEESQEPYERFWLTAVTCNGVEERLVDCIGGRAFLTDAVGRRAFRIDGVGRACNSQSLRLTVACRSFAVPEALEAVSTPGAGATFDCREDLACGNMSSVGCYDQTS